MTLAENEYAAILANWTGFSPVATTLPTTTPSTTVDASNLELVTVCVSILLKPCHAFDDMERDKQKLINIRPFTNDQHPVKQQKGLVNTIKGTNHNQVLTSCPRL
jgi:hypothetical protein